MIWHKIVLIALTIGMAGGCAAQEFRLRDPVVNLSLQGKKQLIFLGFERGETIPPEIGEMADATLYTALQEVPAITVQGVNTLSPEAQAIAKVLRYEDAPERFAQLAPLSGGDVYAIGQLIEYQEFRNSDQNWMPQIPMRSTDNKSIPQQLVEVGFRLRIAFIDAKTGREIWHQSVSAGDRLVLLPPNAVSASAMIGDEELQVKGFRELLLQRSIASIVQSLLPYYEYY